MESICDWFDFNNAKTTKWYRVDGGMSVLTDVLCDVTTKNEHPARVLTESPVTAMQDNDKTIAVTYKDQTGTVSSKDYKAVFNTTTLGCLQQMDLSGLPSLTPIMSAQYVPLAMTALPKWLSSLLSLGGESLFLTEVYQALIYV